jgi:hypothetical protein
MSARPVGETHAGRNLLPENQRAYSCATRGKAKAFASQSSSSARHEWKYQEIERDNRAVRVMPVWLFLPAILERISCEITKELSLGSAGILARLSARARKH